MSVLFGLSARMARVPVNNEKACFMPVKSVERDGVMVCIGEGKSIHILKFVKEASVHIAAYLLPTYKRVAYTSLRKTRCFIFHVTARHSFTKKCKP